MESFYLLHGHRSNLLRFGDALFLVRAILKEAKGLGGRPAYDYVNFAEHELIEVE